MKVKICLAILSMMFVTNTISAQSNMLNDGFSLKFSFGFPPSTYGFDGDLPIPESLQLDNTFGIEIGNLWHFYKGDNIGIGLDINWFDILYGKVRTNDAALGEITRVTLEGSFLEFGPVATFAIGDILALEGYYNLRPSYMVTYYYENADKISSADDYVVLRNFNFLHGFGLGARLKFFYIGYEFTFGIVNGKLSGDGEYEDIDLMYGKQSMDASNSKLIIGFQF